VVLVNVFEIFKFTFHLGNGHLFSFFRQLGGILKKLHSMMAIIKTTKNCVLACIQTSGTNSTQTNSTIMPILLVYTYHLFVQGFLLLIITNFN